MTEKVFLKKMTLSIASMILCLFLFSLSAWAMFGETVSTGNQTLTAANYDIKIKVNGVDLDGYTYTASYEGTYNFSLTSSGTATKGYAKFNLNGTIIATCVIDSKTADCGIALEAGQSVTIIPCWGICPTQSVSPQSTTVAPSPDLTTMQAPSPDVEPTPNIDAKPEPNTDVEPTPNPEMEISQSADINNESINSESENSNNT